MPQLKRFGAELSDCEKNKLEHILKSGFSFGGGGGRGGSFRSPRECEGLCKIGLSRPTNFLWRNWKCPQAIFIFDGSYALDSKLENLLPSFI